MKFIPILQQKIWGGNKLRDLFKKNTDLNHVGESWEVSGVNGFVSIVANGAHQGKSLTDLIQNFKGDFVGKNVYEKFGEEFPLLIKFIDAKKDLSVQLHPNDKLAKKRHNSFGKTEMWYVLQSDQARLNIGFRESLSKEKFLEILKDDRLLEHLHFERVKQGDCFLIEAGKVHSIGAGVLLAEIQQTSDITYRIYDWDRVDDHGNLRELHSELALDAIDFENEYNYRLNYEKKLNASSEIVRCPFFTVNYQSVVNTVTKNYSKIDSFVIYICVKGSVTVSTSNHEELFSEGETFLIPAITQQVKLEAEDSELLEVYIE